MRQSGWLVCVAVLAALSVAGCGSGSNDQGIAFRAVGFFQGTVEGNRCTVPSVTTAIVDQSDSVSLSDPLLQDGYPDPLNFCGVFLQLQNNLVGQAMNVLDIRLDYEIPGFSIGSHTVPGQTIEPADSEQESESGAPNVIFQQFKQQFIPATVVTSLHQNILSLPPFPFPMVIHATAFGVSDSGDSFTSNQVSYTVTIRN